MRVKINKKWYNVNDDEYTNKQHNEYTNLRLINDLDVKERLVAFIKRITKINKSVNRPEVNLIHINPSHGGFVGINCLDCITENGISWVGFTNIDSAHIQNIADNIKEHNIENCCNCRNTYRDLEYYDDLRKCLNIFINDDVNNHISVNWYNYEYSVILSTQILHRCSYKRYLFHCGTDFTYYVYVSGSVECAFDNEFKYYIKNDNDNTPTITYDNLLHLCIMVKNAGPQFKEMLEQNMPFIDQWTILDTGSIDDTIQIINDVLVGKKEGKLYQEPFINFRDSRNRLLDLAGTESKYIVMLDDTYIMKNDIRSFLQEIRSDQYANSFTLMIHSDDTKYGSNRIIRSDSGLRYIHTIHEVITDKDNINIVIPENRCYIFDGRFDYMEQRTQERKQLDLKLLYEEVEENPNDPRAYYYLAQTYNLLEDWEKAFYYFLKRASFVNSGFLQERVDAAFEAARTANFKLNKSWSECEALYLEAFKIDETRPESLYFIGIHYYLENDMATAYSYLKRAFEIGFPEHCQYSLKPTLSFHFLPKFLAKICYLCDDYPLGLKAAELFLTKNPIGSEDYEELTSWYQIYKLLNAYQGPKVPTVPLKPILCFVADGGFYPWSGKNILTTGVGGSETYIIEMARYLNQSNHFGSTIVFCNTPDKEEVVFEGVIYRHLSFYPEFINTTYVHTVVVSRYSEYIPLTVKGFSENVYLVVHDLSTTGIVIPNDKKLKNIFCLTEWHQTYFSGIFSQLAHLVKPFYYGIDTERFLNTTNTVTNKFYNKVTNKFIYSSFPNRGLLQLLQMWPKIHERFPDATLYIYSNVDNEWSNRVEPEKMEQIRQLLNQLTDKGIYYKGWVSKQELAEAWQTADIWFYPCTFQETFCLTALEAAASRTFAVTNGLAALQNTVADRGITIEGDPTTEEWQENALTVLFEYMDTNTGFYNTDKLRAEKELLVQQNYEWSQKLSWKSQAQKLLQEYLIPNSKYEYKGMYNWTNDLPQGSREQYLGWIHYFIRNYKKCQFKKPIRILEIGSYTGTSLIELVNNIPNSTAIGVDLWCSYNENELLTNVDNLKVYDSFYKNIKAAGLEDRIQGIKMDSKDALLSLIKESSSASANFDFIYVDGSHLLLDAYADLILSWELLEKGGLLVIDDYLYKKGNVLESPFESVEHFLKRYSGQYKLLEKSYRVFLEKL